MTEIKQHIPILNVLYHGLGSKLAVIYVPILLISNDAQMPVAVDHLEPKKPWTFFIFIIVSYHQSQKQKMADS